MQARALASGGDKKKDICDYLFLLRLNIITSHIMDHINMAHSSYFVDKNKKIFFVLLCNYYYYSDLFTYTT